MPDVRQYLLPHRMQNTLRCCPSFISFYAMIHLDSIGKILNHILYGMMILNLSFFFTICHATLVAEQPYHLEGAGIPYHALLISFLLCCQNFILWAIINNHRISGCFPCLTPTDFMLGIAVGITIGGALLSFFLSGAFHRVFVECRHFQHEIHYHDAISHGHGGGTSIGGSEEEKEEIVEEVEDFVFYAAFCNSQQLFGMKVTFLLGRLVFWFNFWSCLLLTVGRHELTTKRTLYEPIGSGGTNTSDDEYAAAAASRPTFVGDYTTVPNIFSDVTSPSQHNGDYHDNHHDEVASVTSFQSRSNTAAILTSV